MAAQTPYRGVHWDPPSFDSPTSDTSSAILSTSSLDYINSQLVAHGFAPAPGLSLDGISSTDLDRAVKCLLGMLSQRVDDMKRTEDLTTKLRTLSYDHERLRTMHQTAVETAANAEREMNLHKSRLTAATRSLQASEVAHKHTSAELQRTRTALQAVRATHHSELKKKEKEVERMMEKWSKLADVQAKLSTAASGMRCANLQVVEGVETVGRGPDLTDLALEQAEQARKLLSDENTRLRGLLLGAVNEAQSMLYHGRKSEREDELVPFTMPTLFPMTSQDVANEKLTALLGALREAVTRPVVEVRAPSPLAAPAVPAGELARLQGVIEGLKAELDRAQQQSMNHAAETQVLFDQFVADVRIGDNDVGDASVELMIAPLRDAEKERLENIKMQLDLERRNFTEAALKLGQEKAALEAERARLQDEKRSWNVERMLAELPPTPNQASPLKVSVSRSRPPRKSPRKSPAKVVAVGKAGANRKTTTRISRRSSLSSPPRFQPAFETEVLPPLPAPSFTSTSGSTSLLPTSFVLPPPSPGSAFPAPALLLSSAPPAMLELSSPPGPSQASSGPPPATPPTFRRPFPMAKPYAPRMIHAYSPAKPSPLSRILMLSNSPATPADVVSGLGHEDIEIDIDGLGNTSTALEALLEEDEEAPIGDAVFPVLPPPPPVRQPTLAEELGVSESPPESPEAQLPAPMRASASAGPARVFTREPGTQRFSAQEKGKGRAPEVMPSRGGVGRAAAAAAGGSEEKEKENSTQVRMRRKGAGLPKNESLPLGGGGIVKSGKKLDLGSGSRSHARVMAKLTVPSAAKKGSGARRVLADSAEASVVQSRGWRG